MSEPLLDLVQRLLELVAPRPEDLARVLGVGLEEVTPSDAALGMRDLAGPSTVGPIDRVCLSLPADAGPRLELQVGERQPLHLNDFDVTPFGMNVCRMGEDGELGNLALRFSTSSVTLHLSFDKVGLLLRTLRLVWPPAAPMGETFRTFCSPCGSTAAKVDLVPTLQGLRRVYQGPGGSSGAWGDLLSGERAEALRVALSEPYDGAQLRQAGFYDGAGFCDHCGRIYCPTHWNLTDRGGGFCPAGHFKSLDPHWSPDDD